jgi:hypothetical protein
MTFKGQVLLAGAALAAVAFVSTAAQAGVITVLNPSFEIIDAGGLPNGGCGAGCAYNVAEVPDWTGGEGSFQPGPSSGNFAYFNYVPDGVTVAYSNGAGFSQTVAATAVAGDTYTLTVDLGYRKDIPDPGSIALQVGANTVAGTGAAPQGSGDWSTWTATYTATAADAGAPITILLVGGGSQSDFDNVNLIAAPEPASWALMLVGFGGLGAVLRSRRRQIAAVA